MQISIGPNPKDLARFETAEVASINELLSIIVKDNYSLGTFSESRRTKKGFLKAEAIGLDFDNGLTIEDAVKEFQDYVCIIAPTRNHQKEKNGLVADRFRVILFLSAPITDVESFEATWFSLADKWRNTDPACKDASRFWYPSQFVHSVNTQGKFVDPVQPKSMLPDTEVKIYLTGMKGKLGRNTLEFLQFGAVNGGRNNAVVKAAKDFQQNLYTCDETIETIVAALEANDTITSDFTENEVVTTIRSAFNSDAKHDPRIKQLAFNLQPIGELYKQTAGVEVEWLVQGLLQVGGVSILTADPKAGKSVVARQLCKHVVRGDEFFERKVKRGSCHYYGLEEHRTILAQSFKRLGIVDTDPLFVHVEDPLSEEGIFKDFSDIINQTKPALAVVDTAFDLLEVESENNYREVKKAFKKVRKIARDSGTHILLIHHNSKPQQNFRRRGNHAILGSTAISGGVDSIIVVELEGTVRVITTSGREVDQWNRRIIKWDKETSTYSLGEKYQDKDFF